MKKTILIILFALSFNTSFAQTTLVAGDIAITGHIMAQSEFSFVFLRDITTGTVINFTDRGWLSAGGFRNEAAVEGTLTWTADTDLPCGTEIIITGNTPFSATQGTVTESDVFQLEGETGPMNRDGDQILAYQGTDAAPIFIYALDFNGNTNNWNGNATNSNNSAIPAGLTNNANAVSVISRINGKYDCRISYVPADILAAVSTRSNWFTNDITDVTSNNFIELGLLCNYSCAPPVILSTGDLVITGYNTEDTEVDEFTFVVLTDIAEGTIIGFTDKGWDSTTGAYRSGNAEGFLQWKVPPGGVPCGSEVRIFAAAPGSGIKDYLSNFGTVTEPDAGFGFNPRNDQIIAFSGSFNTPTNAYAIIYGDNDWNEATNVRTSAVPLGLTDGTDAIYYGDFDSGIYDCSTSIGDALIASEVADPLNWSLQKDMGSQTLGGCNYSCCPATMWDGTSWSPIAIPDINTTLILDADYATGTVTNLEACSLIINAGNILTVNNGTYVLVENDVTVDGDLLVESQGNFVQVGEFSSFTNNGTSQVIKTPVSTGSLEYTYWGTPVANAMAGTLGTGDRFWYNSANYLDTMIEIANTGTFEVTSGQDDIDDNGDDWQVLPATDILTPGVGYAATGSATDRTFTGQFNNSNITAPIIINGEAADSDWNLLGNPYPGALDFDAFFAANSGVVGGVAYFWSHNTTADSNASGNEGMNFSQNDYAMYASGAGGGTAAISGGPTPNQYIPSGQGFFIIGLANGNVNFTNAMRVADATSNSLFFKNTRSKKTVKNDNANRLWLNLTSDNGVFNQALVAYVDNATNGNDGLAFDAPRNLSTTGSAILYTTIPEESKKYAIQGKAKSSLNPDEVINFGFKTTIDTPTLYKLSVAKFEGDFLSSNTIFVKDNLLDTMHNLSSSDYTFTSETGEFNERFQIVFNANALSNNDFTQIERSIKIVELENDDVRFTSSNNITIKSVSIFDLLGRQLYNFKATNRMETYKLSNLSSTVYLAKVELANGATVTKKMFKK
ncbi:T9SS type A sorting domain-containing protein [uncultured Algibacter sp.]|uniref:T9SS type A sorting domain-containing protein n=1 Tax=uncultured Algibacter sp. TaxID=298659 RepID=UPI0032177DD2